MARTRTRKRGGGAGRGQATGVEITRARLRAWPLPVPDAGSDKDARGRVLVVGGCPEIPGAVLLAAEAALRAGAGKLQVATGASAAPLVAAALPEARVVPLPQTRAGAFGAGARGVLERLQEQVDAVLVGPGQVPSDTTARMLAGWIGALPASVTAVLDAAGLDSVAALPRDQGPARVLTPHAGEMARLLGIDKARAEADPRACALEAVSRFGGVVVAKGACTWIAGEGALRAPLFNRAGNVGLAMSGSGDTLAGVVAGLAARGAPPLQAAAWGVHLHALAGDALARRIGPLGYLARELLAEIPALMHALSPPGAKQAMRNRA